MILKKVKSDTKFQVYKLYDDNDILKYIFKERLEASITKSKSQYYLSSSTHNYISSLYPTNKPTDFNGKFSLNDNKILTFDYKNKYYELILGSNNVILQGVQYA